MSKDFQVGDIIKNLRTNTAPIIPVTNLAKMLKVSPSFLSQIETGKKCPSVDLAEKIANIYGKDKVKQKNIFDSLLKGIILYKYPEAKHLFVRGEYINPRFCERLKMDWNASGVNKGEVAIKVGLKEADIEWALLEELPISRKQVYMLAKALHQNTTEYLLLSCFMPYESLKILIDSPNVMQTLLMASKMAKKDSGEKT